MKSDNELIAEFMGAKPTRGDRLTYSKDFLKYHTSWDWLMPVVDKIWQVAIDDNSKTHVAGKAIKIIDEQVSIFSSIDEVYKAVVEFIKWHNTQS
jgi:hypothetical protein